MLHRITIQCHYEGEQKPNYNWGSLFHGFLMDALPSEVTEVLHEDTLKPYSQYVLPGADQQVNWTIGMWDSDFSKQIIEAVAPLTRIALQQKGLVLDVKGVQRSSLSNSEYLSRFFTAEKPYRRYEIEFITPSTHRHEGAYVLFPAPELMVRNLSKRYSAFVRDVSLDDPEAMQELARNIRIVRYSLRSGVFYLEKTKITGYLGRLTLVISGPDQLARLAGALLSFAEYSGIGIKTALGMGGVRVWQIP
ncbi:MAG: CRISPR system precrRNA processing endoribonuclease RAMP protein Cas6 [Syntrophomonadaceae bacterium]|nr:CRISPR system precrRNA processing endoribonuclease RAMP protein Cas6 [Syntrophomonadaceae bacterium]